MGSIRTGENWRESWWVTNRTNKLITIGDLLLLPVLKPRKKVDLLHYYSREKISHSQILTQLIKSGKISLNKKKSFAAAEHISVADIDKAITPAEENELGTNGGTPGLCIIGEAEDGDYTDGLFTDFTNDTMIGVAVDRFNEVLGSLAPPPAPDLDNVDVDTNGVTGDLSFDGTYPITGYTIVTGIGLIAPTSGSVSVDQSFVNSGIRVGIINNSTDITGTLNEDVIAHAYSYPANAFGNADLGNLILEFNGVEVRNIDLSTSGAVDDGTSVTGFDISDKISCEFSNGDPFVQFKYRTGSYRIDSGDMNNGWNYARIIHRIDTVDTETNYIDWVIDADTTPTGYSGESLHTLSMTGSKYLSGVEYYTGGTSLFNATIDNAQRNTYIASPSNAITFSDTYLVNPSSESLVNTVGDEAQQHVIVNKSVTINAVRLLKQSISITINVNRTVQTDTSGTSKTIDNILMDNDSSSSNNNSLEDFVDESRRLKSNQLNWDNISLTTDWDETESIADAGNAGYNNGLLVYNDRLYYPNSSSVVNSGDFSTIANGPIGNANYSGFNSTGSRYYYRYWIIPGHPSSSTVNYSMEFNGSGTFVPESTSLTTGSNQLKIHIKLPSQTGWMNCYDSFISGNFNDGDGAYSNGDRTIGGVWNMTTGVKSTASSGGRVYMRITVPQGWTGYLTNIDWDWSHLP